jgi:hypothetical protein
MIGMRKISDEDQLTILEALSTSSLTTQGAEVIEMTEITSGSLLLLRWAVLPFITWQQRADKMRGWALLPIKEVQARKSE